MVFISRVLACDCDVRVIIVDSFLALEFNLKMKLPNVAMCSLIQSLFKLIDSTLIIISNAVCLSSVVRTKQIRHPRIMASTIEWQLNFQMVDVLAD